MVNVYLDIMEFQLPVRYYQFDSWWYYKGKTQGLYLWEPRPDIFPNGMKTITSRMGNTPVVLHNRWFENDTLYYTELGFPFIVESNGLALPLTEVPYYYIMYKAKDWGLIVYEQDWLMNQFLEMNATLTDIYLAENWMLNMNKAAKALSITIQLCGPLPSHVLQSVNMSQVTQLRASPDYQRQVYNANQWSIGYTSILYNSLGVYPFKDCFWSNSSIQYGCNSNASSCQEPNPLLHTLVAALSAGPVAPSDKMGYPNLKILMQATRADGVLLKPDIPARTMDLARSIQHQSYFHSIKN